MPKHLTDAQVDHYRDRGYIAPVDLLTASEAAEARAKLEAYEARSGGPLGGAQRAGGHLLWPWLDELMRHETLLDAVEDLIGPDILCWNSIFWIKEANSPSYVGWHQDLEYWGLDTTSSSARGSRSHPPRTQPVRWRSCPEATGNSSPTTRPTTRTTC